LPKLPVQLKVPLIATVALEATTSIQGCCFWIDIVNCDAVVVVRSVAQAGSKCMSQIL
jgi:hypothetical protein